MSLLLPLGTIAASDSLDRTATLESLQVVSPTIPPGPIPRLAFPVRGAEGRKDPAALTLSSRSVIHPGTMRGGEAPAPSSRLLTRMQHEALRYRRTGPFLSIDALAPSDTLAEEQRARQAERIATRAFNRTLDESLERLARGSPGLDGFLEWMDDFGALRLGRRAGPSTVGSRSANGRAGGVGSAGAGTFGASLGLKIDAHPRLVVRTEFLGVEGRIEAPVGEPLRLSFERPLGPRSRAALRGALARDGRDWATLTFNFSF